jgi:hypothetical protein
LVLGLLSNLKVTVGATPQNDPAGEIYGKVVEAMAETPGRARIRFTSVTPELKLWATSLGSR